MFFNLMWIFTEIHHHSADSVFVSQEISADIRVLNVEPTVLFSGHFSLLDSRLCKYLMVMYSEAFSCHGEK